MAGAARLQVLRTQMFSFASRVLATGVEKYVNPQQFAPTEFAVCHSPTSGE
jgi:hypothetical protein